MNKISIFAQKPCILRNLRSKRERSGFSLLNLTVLEHYYDDREWGAGRMILAMLKQRNTVNKLVMVSSWFG